MMRGSLAARDRGAPDMREVRDITIPGPAGELDARVYRQPVLRDSRILGRAAVAYIRAALAAPQGIPPLDAAAMPPAPPTLVITGGQMDPIRPDARAYVAALRKAGVQVVTREYPTLP